MDAVLNWVWQGIVIALALSVMLRCLARAGATVRYVVCGVGLLIVVILPGLPRLSFVMTSPPVVQAPLAPVLSVPTAAWTSDIAMLMLWSAWAAIQGIRLSRAAIVLRGARRRSRPFPIEVEHRLPHWVRVRDRGRRARLVLSDDVGAAAVLGCGTPLIAVTPSLVEHLSADQLDRVVVHEWAHVQRRDHLVALLQAIGCVVFGWHPAVWWINRRLHLEREVACDEMAVSITGSAKSYASCLLRLSELSARTPLPLAAPAVLSATGLRHRVTSIVSGRVTVSTTWARAWATVAVVTLGVFSAGMRSVEFVVAAMPQIERVRTIAVTGASVTSLPFVADHSLRPAVTAPPPVRPARAITRSEPAPPAIASTAPAPARPGNETPMPLLSAASSPEAEVPRERVALESTPLPAAAAPPGSPALDARRPWSAASDGGIALGRGAKNAGLETAGAFRRFARRVAGSF